MVLPSISLDFQVSNTDIIATVGERNFSKMVTSTRSTGNMVLLFPWSRSRSRFGARSNTRSRSRQHGVTLPQGQAASWPGSETDPGSTFQVPPGKINSWKDQVDLDVFILVYQWKDRQRNVKVRF